MIALLSRNDVDSALKEIDEASRESGNKIDEVVKQINLAFAFAKCHLLSKSQSSFKLF